MPVSARAGLALASGTLLRVGIVLLGFELVLQDMFTLGGRGLLVVVVVVVATFFGTRWAGKRLGVSDGLCAPRRLGLLDLRRLRDRGGP